MSTTTGLVTVAEFERMPEKIGVRQELRHGEVVEMPPPTPNHQEIQYRISRAIEAIASADWRVRSEIAFRPQAEHEVWARMSG
jgi:Uma2 family endonuclease